MCRAMEVGTEGAWIADLVYCQQLLRCLYCCFRGDPEKGSVLGAHGRVAERKSPAGIHRSLFPPQTVEL